jgi:hypothetical protein
MLLGQVTYAIWETLILQFLSYTEGHRGFTEGHRGSLSKLPKLPKISLTGIASENLVAKVVAKSKLQAPHSASDFLAEEDDAER